MRGHYRRRSAPGGAAVKGGGWLIAGALAAVWLWGHFVGFADTPPQPAPQHTPAPTAIGAP
ncbi:hypothetical protein [Streptomyces sp. CBMA123]|uniref:hypothetical protein n=1 Tax=Streptomyces sp. CBMA123 TaxID=1896313 RepID=UPI001CB7B0DB|nr:hypothetical protein [Streptomyces sp. CBMA123]